jgi:5-methylcytosine-specific restriction endonuclease McrA
MEHWHDPTRTKPCITCGKELPLSSFYAYAYTTKQGKASTRYESRCVDCARARRRPGAAGYDGVLAASKRWRARNVEHRAEYHRRRQAEPAVKAMKATHQRLRKARLRAKASDTPEIRAIYAEAKRLEELTKVCPVFRVKELSGGLHVDHIRPLSKQGKHEPSNLQILPGWINSAKGAKHDDGAAPERPYRGA